MKILRSGFCLAWAIGFSLLWVGSVFAQSSGLQLSLGKISGIGLGGQIQGLFQLSISGPADLTSVTFSLDGKELGTMNQAPFNFQFYTDSYTPGAHQFTATARTASGQSLTSNPVNAEIVSFSSGWQSAMGLLWPLFLIILVALVSAFAVPILSLRGSRRYEPGAARQYGIGGGTVCRGCGRPYALSFLSPRVVVGRLARCPYCGKWTVTRPASPEVLRAAEQAEIAKQPGVRVATPEETLRQQVEDSRLSR